MMMIALMTRGMESELNESQMKYPMPVPPASISAATITSQAIPMERRIPVAMCGSECGMAIRVTYCQREKRKTLATLRYSIGIAFTPNGVLNNVGQSDV